MTCQGKFHKMCAVCRGRVRHVPRHTTTTVRNNPKLKGTRLKLHECKAGVLSKYPAQSVPRRVVRMILVLTVKISTRQRGHLLVLKHEKSRGHPLPEGVSASSCFRSHGTWKVRVVTEEPVTRAECQFDTPLDTQVVMEIRYTHFGGKISEHDP